MLNVIYRFNKMNIESHNFRIIVSGASNIFQRKLRAHSKVNKSLLLLNSLCLLYTNSFSFKALIINFTNSL